ncbi:MAG: TonB family protein [Myxococcales bacterium]|nr:TonB family protein [Myxococcales bacterium]MDD9969238.1 TonB family protein [Myxococcales bacterium]
MARWLAAAPSAALVAFGLFFLMQAMVALRSGELDPAVSGKVVGFVRLKRDLTPPAEEPQVPERPPPVDEPPPTDMTPDTPDTNAPTQSLAVAAPSVDTGFKMASGAQLATAVGDTDAVPLLRVEPRYPPVQAQEGVEGWVKLRFSIGKSGQTKNVSVVDSKPPVVFDEAALTAVRKWKYQPKVVDGQQVERHGLVIRLTFNLDK